MKGAFDRRLKELEQQLSRKEMLDIAYDYFVDTTPIDKGNARKSTFKNNVDTIHANYAYATRLNNGWSNQARDGMSRPTIKHLQQYIRQVRK